MSFKRLSYFMAKCVVPVVYIRLMIVLNEIETEQ